METAVIMGNVERLSSSLPSSLRTLWIFHCPKLRELPQDSLPLSLERLWIFGRGILQKQCMKRYQHLIREIPEVVLWVQLNHLPLLLRLSTLSSSPSFPSLSRHHSISSPTTRTGYEEVSITNSEVQFGATS